MNQATKRRRTKPLVVEVFGLPRAGKTTLIREICSLLSSEGLRVRVVPDFISRDSTSTRLEGEMSRNLFAAGQLSAVLAELMDVPTVWDIVLLDRGVAGLRAAYEDFDNSRPFLRSIMEEVIEALLPCINGGIYLKITPRMARARQVDSERGLSKEKLKRMAGVFDQRAEELAREGKMILICKEGRLTRKTYQQVAEKLLEMVKKGGKSDQEVPGSHQKEVFGGVGSAIKQGGEA